MTGGIYPTHDGGMTTAELISLIEQSAASRGMKPSTFCRHAVNDGNLYARLQRGGTVTIETARRITEFASEVTV